MTLLIVDDHVLFVEALKSMLENSGIEVVGTAGDGLQALEQVRLLHPELVLMDINMPRCDGFEATRRIKAEFPEVKVVILTMSSDDGDLFKAVRCGVSGYITKDTSPDVFVRLLEGLSRGEVAVTRQATTRILHEYARLWSVMAQHGATVFPLTDRNHTTEPELSPRQIEILRMISDGYTYKEIAVSLSTSVRTINYHITEILDKLRLRNRAQAIAYATSHGLLNQPPTIPSLNQPR